MKFGAWIRAHRLRQNLSMDRVCKVAKLSKAYLSLIETGRAGPPKDKVVIQIAKQLDLDQKDLLLRAHRERFPEVVVDLRNVIEETREALADLDPKSSSTTPASAKQVARKIEELVERLETLAPSDPNDDDDLSRELEDLRVEERQFILKMIKEVKKLRPRQGRRSTKADTPQNKKAEKKSSKTTSKKTAKK